MAVPEWAAPWRAQIILIEALGLWGFLATHVWVAKSAGEPGTTTRVLTLPCFSHKALVGDAIQDESQDDSVYLPPCHADAAKPEDVYKFEDRILLVG